jgi:hypothetical protein
MLKSSAWHVCVEPCPRASYETTTRPAAATAGTMPPHDVQHWAVPPINRTGDEWCGWLGWVTIARIAPYDMGTSSTRAWCARCAGDTKRRTSRHAILNWRSSGTSAWGQHDRSITADGGCGTRRVLEEMGAGMAVAAAAAALLLQQRRPGTAPIKCFAWGLLQIFGFLAFCSKFFFAA